MSQFIVPTEGDGAWHGACLAIAEFARRGLLVPNRISSVMPSIISVPHCEVVKFYSFQALSYDVRKGRHSIGAHVRDAACYVLWAFARTYTKEDLAPFALSLARALIVRAVFDREVNCRRAAAAAFQESVGRLVTTLANIPLIDSGYLPAWT